MKENQQFQVMNEVYVKTAAANKKQLSVLSAVLLIIGSCIGIGIFFRPASILQDNSYSFLFAIISWVLAIIAVIAMALCLIEISSANKSGKGGLERWARLFNARWMWKGIRNFIVYLYTPLMVFTIGIYAVQFFSDGITSAAGKPNNSMFGLTGAAQAYEWLILLAIVLVLSGWFLLVSGVFVKLANFQNWLSVGVKFFPLVAFPVLAIIVMATQGVIASHATSVGTTSPVVGFLPSEIGRRADSLVTISPLFGVFLGVVSIFFTLDGFYMAASLQNEMREPKKSGLATIVGLLIVASVYVLFFVLVAISKVSGFSSLLSFAETKASGLAAALNLAIGVSALGVINNFSLYGIQETNESLARGELLLGKFFQVQALQKRYFGAALYQFGLLLICFVVFGLIGSLAFTDTGGYASSYSTQIAGLISLADILSNWTSLFMFVFITFILHGGLVNRKTKRVQVNRFKLYKPLATLAIVILSFVIAIQLFQPLIDLILLALGQTTNTSGIVSRVLLFVVLVIFLAVFYAQLGVDLFRYHLVRQQLAKVNLNTHRLSRFQYENLVSPLSFYTLDHKNMIIG